MLGINSRQHLLEVPVVVIGSRYPCDRNWFVVEFAEGGVNAYSLRVRLDRFAPLDDFPYSDLLEVFFGPNIVVLLVLLCGRFRLLLSSHLLQSLHGLDKTLVQPFP